MRLHRAILRAFDPVGYLADVQIQGSRHADLAAIDVSRAIPAVEMVAGRTVAVVQFWPGDPASAVVIAVW